MAAAMAQPRPITPPTGAAPTHEVWEVAEPPLAEQPEAPLPGTSHWQNLPRTVRREGEAAAAARAAAVAAQSGARPAVAPLPLPRALRREGPPLPRYNREGEAAAAARAAAVARAALDALPQPPAHRLDPITPRRRVNANIHLSLTTEFATLVGETPPSFPCPSRRRNGPTLHVSLQPEFAELLGLEESDEDDDDRSILSAVSFSARCVPIDEDERPRSAGSTVSFRVRPTSPASVVSEDIEADATWCGNWRSRRAAQEPEDEMDVTSLRTALALARRDAAAARADAAAARRHARRRAGAARADALAARRSARDAAEAFDAVAEAAAAAARDASRARSNQAAAEAAHAAARAQLRRARDGEVFVDALDALEAFDDVPPPPRPPSPPLTPDTALSACERAFRCLQPLSLDTLTELDARIQHLGDEVRRAVVDRARCGDEASQCALCCAASKSVAFVDCGHAVCGACVERVDRCPFCRGPAAPTIRIHL